MRRRKGKVVGDESNESLHRIEMSFEEDSKKERKEDPNKIYVTKIERVTDYIGLVHLSAEPDLHKELTDLQAILNDDPSGYDCVVIDFSGVDIVKAESIRILLKLRSHFLEPHRKLLLCSVSKITKDTFLLVGLDGVLEIVSDKFIALATASSFISGFGH